ncbi:MAG: signal peptidase II [Elusimicrobiota bacterium]|nr:MAG: signal peptidase II [Elusimicrobiota bacterium]
MRALRASAVVVLLALDRATKAWAFASLRPVGTIPLVPFFDLTYVENTGAAFGMGRGAGGILTAVSVALVIALQYLRRKWPQDDPWLQWGAWLVTAGAVGNLYDRFAYGYVVDFLHIHHWPVFNVADSCITVGAGLLAWGLRDEPGAKKAPAKP